MVQGNFQPAGIPVQALTWNSPSRANLLTGVSPTATAVDNVLAVFNIPGGSFVGTGQEIFVEINGSFAANANVKTVKIIWGPTTAVVGGTVVGGTTISSTGAGAFNGGGFSMQASVAKVGLPGSNTQLGTAILTQASIAIALTAPTFPTATEATDTLIAVTGNAATATTDIVLNAFEVAGR